MSVGVVKKILDNLSHIQYGLSAARRIGGTPASMGDMAIYQRSCAQQCSLTGELLGSEQLHKSDRLPDIYVAA